MPYYTEEQSNQLGFKSVGVNVKISDKANIYDYEKAEIGNNHRVYDFCIVPGMLKIG